jgi:biopolymer transport protein ExbB/TolQ
MPARVNRLPGLPHAGWIRAGAVAGGLLFVLLGWVTLGPIVQGVPAGDLTLSETPLAWQAGVTLFGVDDGLRAGDSAAPGHPLTIQAVMLLLFFLGCGELYCRWRIASWEAGFLDAGWLPEDPEVLLQAHHLGPMRERVAEKYDGQNGFLASLIDLCILQFQASRSVDQTVSVLNSKLELLAHQLELRYSAIRYIVWVIPTIGFIGTVLGLAGALASFEGQVGPRVLGQLGLAFNTTFVALLLSAVLVLFLHLVQSREEQSLNRAGSYTLANFINRLYSPGT